MRGPELATGSSPLPACTASLASVFRASHYCAVRDLAQPGLPEAQLPGMVERRTGEALAVVSHHPVNARGVSDHYWRDGDGPVPDRSWIADTS